MRHATYEMQPESCDMRHATCDMRHATHVLERQRRGPVTPSASADRVRPLGLRAGLRLQFRYPLGQHTAVQQQHRPSALPVASRAIDDPHASSRAPGMNGTVSAQTHIVGHTGRHAHFAPSGVCAGGDVLGRLQGRIAADHPQRHRHQRASDDRASRHQRCGTGPSAVAPDYRSVCASSPHKGSSSWYCCDLTRVARPGTAVTRITRSAAAILPGVPHASHSRRSPRKPTLVALQYADRPSPLAPRTTSRSGCGLAPTRVLKRRLPDACHAVGRAPRVRRVVWWFALLCRDVVAAVSVRGRI